MESRESKSERTWDIKLRNFKFILRLFPYCCCCFLFKCKFIFVLS